LSELFTDLKVYTWTFLHTCMGWIFERKCVISY